VFTVFYCLHALADGSWHIWIREKTLLVHVTYTISIPTLSLRDYIWTFHKQLVYILNAYDIFPYLPTTHIFNSPCRLPADFMLLDYIIIIAILIYVYIMFPLSGCHRCLQFL